MINLKNQTYYGANNRPSLLDLNIPTPFSGKLIIFIHGYMGFKDWGCWNLVEDYFTQLGFGFCKYNVSHNGCTVKKPKEFSDLDAFSKNNYSKESIDFEKIVEFLKQELQPLPEIYVIGHSRGGGIAILNSKNAYVKKICTWAAISNIERRFPKGDELKLWKENQFYIRLNGRTNQEMPHHYSQYEDFIKNKAHLNIQKAAEEANVPLLYLHGDADTSVSIQEGVDLAQWSKNELKIIEGANHTFDSAEPWTEKEMPKKLISVCEITAEFFLKS